MESIELIFPFVSAVITVPLVAWLKKRFFTLDLPFRSVAVTALINLALIWAMAEIFAPDVPFREFIKIALTGQFFSQVGHAGIKTKKKLNGG